MYALIPWTPREEPCPSPCSATAIITGGRCFFPQPPVTHTLKLRPQTDPRYAPPFCVDVQHFPSLTAVCPNMASTRFSSFVCFFLLLSLVDGAFIRRGKIKKRVSVGYQVVVVVGDDTNDSEIDSVDVMLKEDQCQSSEATEKSYTLTLVGEPTKEGDRTYAADVEFKRPPKFGTTFELGVQIVHSKGIRESMLVSATVTKPLGVSAYEARKLAEKLFAGVRRLDQCPECLSDIVPSVLRPMQELKTLAQDIRREVQDKKNEGRASGPTNPLDKVLNVALILELMSQRGSRAAVQLLERAAEKENGFGNDLDNGGLATVASTLQATVEDFAALIPEVDDEVLVSFVDADLEALLMKAMQGVDRCGKVCVERLNSLLQVFYPTRVWWSRGMGCRGRTVPSVTHG